MSFVENMYENRFGSIQMNAWTKYGWMWIELIELWTLVQECGWMTMNIVD
jgi:hypothetical protein